MPSLSSSRKVCLAYLLAKVPLVLCTPLQGHVNRQQNNPLLTQVTAWSSSHPHHDNQPSNDQPTLPPVSDVFKMVMADTDPNVPQVMMPSALSDSFSTSHVSASKSSSAALSSVSTSSLSSVTTDGPASATSSPTYYGPGLVVASTPSPEVAPAPTSVTDNSDTESSARESSSASPKLIAIALILAGLIVLIIMIFVLDWRLFAICCRTREKDEPEVLSKLVSPLSDANQDSEKPTTVDVPTWLLFSKLASTRGRGTKSDGTTKALLPEEANLESKVIDISAENNFPRSKFSVSSSEYPTSVESYARTSAGSTARHDASSSPLLPAYEFCCMPTSTESFEENHHSRTLSAPIFGHAISSDHPGVMLRPGEHRRSRSISGLTYTVRNPSEYRISYSGSSASSEWKESPPDLSTGLSSSL